MKKIEWKFKSGIEEGSLGGGDFWYDLFDGGYIRPEEIITDDNQVLKIEEAMHTLRSFSIALQREGLLYRSSAGRITS